MCFSATASFTAAGVLGVIGILTMRAARGKTIRSIAIIPMIFAFQQMLEGIVWVTITSGQIHSLAHTYSVWGFLIFAGIFWPIWVPWALCQNEKIQWRKNILKVNLVFGILLASFSGYLMVTMGTHAQIIVHHIAYLYSSEALAQYQSSLSEIVYKVMLVIYFMVAIGSAFVSSLNYVWIFGLLAGIGFVVAQISYAYAFGSVWCFFSAVISMICYWIVKKAPNP